jgi:hypothetical protein
MHLRQNPKRKFPKRAMAKAEKMCRDFLRFPKAADALQGAVDRKNSRSEMYWRNVFGAFSWLAFRRQRWMTESPWHLANTAAMYAYGGDNPRPELDAEGERENEEYNRMRREAPYPKSDPVEGDDQIPFD